MSRLEQIETFVLVVELRSLAEAARELHISSAAVSKQITKLEEELGVQLLIRSTRNVEPTEIGLNYYDQCTRILDEVAEASALISQSKAEPHGPLRVMSSPYFAKRYIVPHLEKFLTQYSEIRLQLELGERIPSLEAEAFDIVVGMSLSVTGQAMQRRIANTRYVFCASPQYLKEHGRPEKPEDLLKHRYITHSMRQPSEEVTFRGKEVLRLHPYLIVNDAETMRIFAEKGMGIVKLHEYVVAEALANGTLEEILQQYGEKDIPLYVAFIQRRFIPSKVRCFIDFLAEVIS